jgi:negative regulator of sigma E activity
MNEDQRASQLSAMFDGELPAGECELMARRLTRDDALRAHWERYALIGAAIRREAGEPLDLRVADRVRHAISAEASFGEGNPEQVVPATQRAKQWMRPAAGFVAAAMVAGIAVVGLRGRDAGLSVAPAPVVASADNALQATVVLGPGASAEPESYVVPVTRESVNFVPPAQLANYVVAHSEVSMPLSRRNLLSALVATEPDPGAADATAPSLDVIDVVDEP